MKEIRPIRTEADNEAALDEIETLWGSPLGTPKGDRLDVLITLVDAFEEKHYPIPPPDPIAAIRFRMEQMGLTNKDLTKFLGESGRVSEILNKNRALSINHIRNLEAGLNIPAGILIKKYELKKKEESV